MRSFKHWSGIIALVLVLSMLLTACTPQAAPTAAAEGEPTAKPEPTAEPTKEAEPEAEPTAAEPVEKVLRINEGSYPDIIDPQRSSYVGEIGHLQLIYEGLTTFDTDLETVPGAAESWEYNDDATELTFTLREGLQYSDGSPLNAMRFKFSIMRNIDPNTAGEYSYITDYILGAAEWRSSDPTDAAAYDAAKAVVDGNVQAYKMDGTTVCDSYDDTDCRILTVKLGQPTPYMHTVLGIWVAYPAKEENITEGGENWWNSSVWQIGNGPFILKTLEPFVRARFVPNPNYHGEKAKVDIEYSYIIDSAISFQAYLNDEFDIVGLASEDLQTVESDPELSEQMLIYPQACTFALQFNLTKEPFNDPSVRKAFSMALDRDAYAQDVLAGLGTGTLTWIPEGIPGANEAEDRWAFDPEAAKAELANSVYGSVEGLPLITATFGDSPRNRVRWEWMADNFKKNLGVEIELNPIDPTTFTSLTKDTSTMPQMILLGWCSDYPDPQNWLSVYWSSSSEFAKSVAYANPELDALLAQADVELDPDARLKMYEDAQDMLIEELPAVMFYNRVNSFLVKPWVTGIETTPQDGVFPGQYAANLIDIDTSLLP
ncbi:MAG: peptide ABC transporter substrate-binding protein [Chloroflexi bacterium]|nr:peptide ABC transporter substrate-binding protein [Chloroflexota bacterium]